ncbi:hypothetical protein F4804DRAFT_191561 [Jackrogersella minutella]|nr:hypothetical protein F4804DRAFT_191561 [Jackrogersella minutella]
MSQERRRFCGKPRRGPRKDCPLNTRGPYLPRIEVIPPEGWHACVHCVTKVYPTKKSNRLATKLLRQSIALRGESTETLSTRRLYLRIEERIMIRDLMDTNYEGPYIRLAMHRVVNEVLRMLRQVHIVPNLLAHQVSPDHNGEPPAQDARPAGNPAHQNVTTWTTRNAQNIRNTRNTQNYPNARTNGSTGTALSTQSQRPGASRRVLYHPNVIVENTEIDTPHGYSIVLSFELPIEAGMVSICSEVEVSILAPPNTVRMEVAATLDSRHRHCLVEEPGRRFFRD